MLTNYEKFRFVDESKQNEFYVEVNWNPNDSKSNKCQMLKVIFPNGQSAIVRREHFFSMLFACGTEEQQRKSIPQKLSRVKYWNTVLGIKATKDIAKGEMINVPVNLQMPDWEQDIIADIKTTARKHQR